MEQQDIVALALKNDVPHCDFGGHQVLVRNVKKEVLARFQHVSIYDDASIAYDETLRLERGGSIFLPVTPQGLIGMRQVWRPQTRDPNYRANFPEVDLSQLGQLTWDICGGYGDPGTTPEQAARGEAEEESRFPVVDIEYLGKSVMNRGSDGHFTHLFWGTLDTEKPTITARDILEKNADKMRFFTQGDVYTLFTRGELYDQCIMSALWAFGRKYPGRLA